MGNLGQRNPYCHLSYFGNIKPTNLTCAVGKISKLDYVGLNPEGGDRDKNYCGETGHHKNSMIQNCTENFLETEAFTQFFNTQCYNKKTCIIN